MNLSLAMEGEDLLALGAQLLLPAVKAVVGP